MRGFQKLTALGHVGQDPEMKYLANGDAVVGFSIAVSESWKDKQTGEKKERTEWIRCSAFGKLAEIIGQYVKKGSPLFIEGQLRTDQWEDKDGTKKSATKVIVSEIRLLGDGKQADNQAPPATTTSQRPPQSQRQPQREAPPPDMEEDIPFD